MRTEIFQGLNLYFVSESGALLSAEQDALDLLGEVYGLETDIIVIPAERFASSFFDLGSKQAGHFFQKMQNYQVRLAIVGDISEYASRSTALTDFVTETNRVGKHLFVSNEAELKTRIGVKI